MDDYGYTDRYIRSSDSKIRLLGSTVNSLNVVTYTVQGVTADYNVIYDKYMQCTCPDFMKRNRGSKFHACKHIYFIFSRYFGFSKHDIDCECITITQVLTAIDQKTNVPIVGECPICLEDVLDDNVATCSNGHASCGTCISQWRKASPKNTTCPLCRTIM